MVTPSYAVVWSWKHGLLGRRSLPSCLLGSEIACRGGGGRGTILADRCKAGCAGQAGHRPGWAASMACSGGGGGDDGLLLDCFQRVPPAWQAVVDWLGPLDLLRLRRTCR